MSAVNRDNGRIHSLPIGVFDSGIGGLTVVNALQHRLPGESILYLGDVARQPYGTKAAATVVRYGVWAADQLVRRGVKMLVIACNTATAHALTAIRRQHPAIPVLGVVQAGAEAAIQAGARRIVVAATEGTCRSLAFPSALTALMPDVQVQQVACPLFVALAEEGLTDGPIAEDMVRTYLAQSFPPHGTGDCLLLGCTHFPLLIPALRTVLGPQPLFVDCASAVAEQAAVLLRERQALAINQDGNFHALVTDAPQRFQANMHRFLSTPPRTAQVELIDF